MTHEDTVGQWLFVSYDVLTPILYLNHEITTMPSIQSIDDEHWVRERDAKSRYLSLIHI